VRFAQLRKLRVYSSQVGSTYIIFDISDRASQADLCIYIGSVPTEHLDTFDDRLKDSLKRIVKEGIDMDRMSRVINRDERQVICVFVVSYSRL
jgi:hypothetical protein